LIYIDILTRKKRIYSHIHRHKGSVRLDRIYINTQNTPNIKQINYKPINFSDHKILEMIITTENMRWGKGKWKINNSTLLNDDYKNKIQESWRQWENDPRRTLNIGEWWELGKEEIKQITVKYCTDIKSKRDKKYNELTEKLLKMRIKQIQKNII